MQEPAPVTLFAMCPESFAAAGLKVAPPSTSLAIHFRNIHLRIALSETIAMMTIVPRKIMNH